MSNNIKRKIERRTRLKEKKEARKNLEKMVKNIFLPEFCKNCNGPFDKKSKEQAKTWRVISKDEGSSKYLLCPTCWNKFQELMPSE
tara:strand:- start:474 stop:731 length:258 start_codon:yes stop_codon:yes gene_type:complete